jgi:hypothetical protein
MPEKAENGLFSESFVGIAAVFFLSKMLSFVWMMVRVLLYRPIL